MKVIDGALDEGSPRHLLPYQPAPVHLEQILWGYAAHPNCHNIRERGEFGERPAFGWLARCSHADIGVSECPLNDFDRFWSPEDEPLGNFNPNVRASRLCESQRIDEALKIAAEMRSSNTRTLIIGAVLFRYPLNLIRLMRPVI